MKPIFVTGISTEVGKTVTSACLVEKFKLDYWKPVQSGDLDNSDTHKVKSLIANTTTKFYSEAYRLTQPFSPHKSAAIDGIEISLNNITLPDSENLLIEGAGGLFVPLNHKHYIIDLIAKFDAEVILVVKHYLGSINHTLLSIDALRSRGIKIKGIIYNGEADTYSEEAVSRYSSATVLGRIPQLPELSKESVKNAGRFINELF